MRIVTVLGARPQFIKASVVSHAISTSNAVSEVVVHTGQHFDPEMSEVFFEELGMSAPEYQLNIHGGGHGAMTGRMLAAVEEVLLKEQPDAVLVYGDTNSTLAGALAAAKLDIPVAHVEAGLRSFNRQMPEEINRVLTDQLSQWLFSPTEAAAQHLQREGIATNRVFPVGDVMYDVALHHGSRVGSSGGILAELGIESRAYVLVTIHRAENTDNRIKLGVLADALEATARDVPVVWPLHPRTRLALQELGRLEALRMHVKVLDPVGYLTMVQLEKNAALIATDSGGVQKEAFFYRVPCVTLREQTEWTELVDAGWNRLVPPESASIVQAAIRRTVGTAGLDISPYGDGNAAGRIVMHLAQAS